jgi:hypothetical protein
MLLLQISEEWYLFAHILFVMADSLISHYSHPPFFSVVGTYGK